MKFIEKYSKYITAFIFCVAVIAVYKTFDNLSHIGDGIGTILGALKPFVVGFIIAYILNMPARRLQMLMEKSSVKFISAHSKGLSILVVYLIAVIVVIVMLSMLIPALYKNFVDLYNNIPNYVQAISEHLKQFEILNRFNLQDLNITKSLETLITSFDISQIGKYAQGVFSVTSGVLSTIVAIIASIYMLLDKERLQTMFVRVLGAFLRKRSVAAVVYHARRINEIFTNYIYARLACSIIMAIICSIVLSVMNVKYALILGMFIGAMDMIPYFGSIISCIIAIFITIITGGFWQGLWTAVVLLVLQQIDGNILGPKIMGDSLEIRPFWVIFAVSVGGTLFGFAGMLISVPVIAIIRVILNEYVESRERKMQIKNKQEEAREQEIKNE